MKRLRVVVSLPNDNAYQHAQGLAAKTTAQSLGIQVDLLHAQDDSITQSQQLLEIIQGSGAERRRGAARCREPFSRDCSVHVKSQARAAAVAGTPAAANPDA